MSWRESRVVDIAVDIVVYNSATHGEHAGKLSCLLTTRHCEVFGFGMNTLVTNAIFNRDCPMQEGNSTFFSSWVKVEKLCEHSIRKIAIGHGCGAAVTRNHELLTWGKGATTYLPARAVEIVELYNPEIECKFCNTYCVDYGRQIGNTWFSYCKQQQRLVTYSSTSPPPVGVPVKRLGNRWYGALTCSACMDECDIQVMENHTFNFCNNCNNLWDLDENERPMNFMNVPVDSFLRRLAYPGRIRDVTYARWGFWVLTDTSRLVFSGFFLHPDTHNVPIWWKQTLGIPSLRLPHKMTSTHSSKTDVFVLTDKGALYKRFRNDGAGNTDEPHVLKRIPLELGVRKMCCGRFASLCLLDDGALWIIYSQQSLEDFQMNPEKISSGGAKGCMDVSGITCADLFYVQTSQNQDPLRIKHPAMGNVLIEIIFGLLDSKTFLWHFSDHCRVWNEGKISYDPMAATQLINRQLDILRAREEMARAEEDREVTPTMPIPADTMIVQPTSAGLGFPVRHTLWSSWGSSLLRNVATARRSFVGGSKWVYRALLEQIKQRPLAKPAPSSEHITSQFNLPPFQCSLFGKKLFADLTLRLYDGNFPAHRIVLCSTSKYFKMKLADGSSNITSLDVKLYNPRAYRCLLKYYYQIEPDDLILKDLIDLLILAKTYQEYHITGEIEEKIKSKINADNVTKIMEVAKEYSANSVLEKCELFRQNPASQEKDEAAPTPTTSTFARPLNTTIPHQ